MTPEPFDRVRTAAPADAPPCPQRCWEQVGRGWVFTAGVDGRCGWDERTRKWTRCVPDESENAK